jgi:diguanylate cyclase (GGDEF)-like protein
MKPASTDGSRQAETDLLVFHEIARALTSSLDLDSILTTILRHIQRLFQPDTWALLLTDEQGKGLYCAMADGRLSSRISEVRAPGGERMADWVAERGEPLIVRETSGEGHPETQGDLKLDFDVRSAVAIPLRSRHRTLGVIQLFNMPPDTLSDYAVSFLLVLCDYAAIAIENDRAFKRVQELTIIDECTGLFNVRHFEQCLKNEITRSGRLNVPTSLIFLDLDRFKLVNDRYGHQVGSRLLAQVGATIRAQVRSIDLAFRYGGDEFTILLPGTIKRSAIQVANRLLSAFRTAVHSVPDDVHVCITASFGVASYPEDGKTGEEILRAADARMYEVKGTTRDAVAFSGRGRPLEKPS